MTAYMNRVGHMGHPEETELSFTSLPVQEKQQNKDPNILVLGTDYYF